MTFHTRFTHVSHTFHTRFTHVSHTYIPIHCEVLLGVSSWLPNIEYRHACKHVCNRICSRVHTYVYTCSDLYGCGCSVLQCVVVCACRMAVVNPALYCRYCRYRLAAAGTHVSLTMHITHSFARIHMYTLCFSLTGSG